MTRPEATQEEQGTRMDLKAFTYVPFEFSGISSGSELIQALGRPDGCSCDRVEQKANEATSSWK